MTTTQRIPVAQYLRMSTEHQQYSAENQSLAIQNYAAARGFEIVRTYLDAAKSGLVLRRRVGLQQLLKDVVSGASGYRAILVYDVSRWGRFQDTDESAHYEFLCKSAGVPVHYCAEPFTNDNTFANLIMKTLKRTMAGEYSRDLGFRVYEGQKRLTLLGFKQGGVPGYGLRRMLVSSSGVPKQELASGERKSIATDRVILVPGPAHEVQTIKEIYRMLLTEKRSVCSIARKLNETGVPRPGHSKWDHYAVRSILTNPKYAGCAVIGRSSGKLYTPRVKVPRSEWILKAGAFEALIDADTFAQTQKAYARRNFSTTDAELLDDLRALLASEGRLSLNLIKHSPAVGSPSTYRSRFGSLRNSYKLIGYTFPGQFDRVDKRIRSMSIRETLTVQIAQMFSERVSMIRRGGRWRTHLRFASGLIVSVLVVRPVRVWKDALRWIVDPVRRERKSITLLVRLEPTNQSILDMYVAPNMDHDGRFNITLNDPWLKRCARLFDLSHFCEVVARVQRARKH